MTDWSSFDVQSISPITFVKRNLIHAEVLARVLRRARGSVLEVGIGSGAQSALLSHFVKQTVSIDNDDRIMRAALSNLRRYASSVRVLEADAFRLPFKNRSFGVAVSQGLMEHFEDAEISRLLREQLRVSRSVVFSVPSDRYPRQDVGNERLMPPQRWAEIVGNAVVNLPVHVTAAYASFDMEAVKYSFLARRWLGSFAVVVTIDPIGSAGDPRSFERQDRST